MDSQIQQNNQLLDAIKLILPIVTFFLGYFLSQLNRYLDKRREINNLKTILFWELSINHYVLFVMDKELIKMEEEQIYPIIKKAYTSQKLVTSVYDAYLNKLNLLNPDELHSVLFAYQNIIRTKEHGKDALDFVRTNVVD